jgi:hypothetical protein
VKEWISVCVCVCLCVLACACVCLCVCLCVRNCLLLSYLRFAVTIVSAVAPCSREQRQSCRSRG